MSQNTHQKRSAPMTKPGGIAAPFSRTPMIADRPSSNIMGYANGGKIKGPGTPTSDSIPAVVKETGQPIRVANKERILSAAQDQIMEQMAVKMGFDSLDAMLESGTGKPVGPTMKGGIMAAEGGSTVDKLKEPVPAMPTPPGIGANTAVNPSPQAQSPLLGGVPNNQAQVQRGAPMPQAVPVQAPPVAATPNRGSLDAPWYSPAYATAANQSDKSGLDLENARRAASGVTNDPVKSLLKSGIIGSGASPANPLPGSSPQAGTPQAKPAGYSVPTGQAEADRIRPANQSIMDASPSAARTQVTANANNEDPASIQPAAGAPQGIASTMSDTKLRQGVRSQDLGIGDFQSGTGVIVGSNGKVTRIDSRPVASSAQPQQHPGGESILDQATRLSRSSNADDRVLGAKLFRHGVDNQLKQAQTQGIMATTDSAQMLADIQKKALAGDPQAMASYLALTGKKPNAATDRYMTVQGGEEVGADGMTKIKKPSGVFDAQTGQFVPMGAGQQQAQAPASAVEYLKKNPSQAAAFKAKYGYTPEGF